MKKLFVLLIFILSVNVFAQSNAQKIYDTEKTFEKAVAEKGIKQGFLEYLADEGFIFNPSPVNGKEAWNNRPDSPASLTWNPVFIDVSSNGALAYSTGNGIFRPKGKDDPNAYYSEYATVWQRQPNGNYKAVLDIGVSHDKPASIETEWKSPAASTANSIVPKINSTVAAQSLFETAQSEGVSKAYKIFAADDIRLLRENSMPIIGKKAALEQTKKEKDAIKFTKRMFFVSAGDLAYLSDTFTLSKDGKITGKGNIVQVWKLRNGVWQIVLDVITPIPLEQK
ncbi:MAG: DUF4440 domain-containing protein [Pyrinomonadaceae bacterium]